MVTLLLRRTLMGGTDHIQQGVGSPVLAIGLGPKPIETMRQDRLLEH